MQFQGLDQSCFFFPRQRPDWLDRQLGNKLCGEMGEVMEAVAERGSAKRSRVLAFAKERRESVCQRERDTAA